MKYLTEITSTVHQFLKGETSDLAYHVYQNPKEIFPIAFIALSATTIYLLNSDRSQKNKKNSTY